VFITDHGQVWGDGDQPIRSRATELRWDWPGWVALRSEPTKWIERRQPLAPHLGEQLSASLIGAVTDSTAGNMHAVADKLGEDYHRRRSGFVNMVNRFV
jgi:hypothetical protein